MSFVTFDTLRVDSPETAAELVEDFVRDTRERVCRAEGFLSARAHLSLDGTTVVNSGKWASPDAYRTFLGARASARESLSPSPGVRALSVFRGTEGVSIEGPAAAEAPGIVSVATRHIGGRKAAIALTTLLTRSGAWKRGVAGFIGATAYLSQDVTTYVNYPQWVDEESYQRYMADPRNAAGQQEIARYETAPAEFVLCGVVSEITGDEGQTR